MSTETVFTLEATPIKFGPGASADAGWELKRLGASRVMVVSDPGIVEAGITGRVVEAIEAAGHRGRRLRPRARRADRGVAAGGGRLRGRRRLRRLRRRRRRLEPRHRQGRRPGRDPPGADHGLRQRAGRRGQEAARAAEAAAGDPDDGGHRVGGDHRRRPRHPRPADQERHLAPLPAPAPGHRRPGADARRSAAEVTSSCGLDVVCHAVESFVSKPYDARERPESPDDRPPYQGANPVSDVWSAKALEYGGRYLRRAVAGRRRPRGARRA